MYDKKGRKLSLLGQEIINLFKDSSDEIFDVYRPKF